MNTRLDAMKNNINERLDSLEDSVEEIKSTVEQCCNDSTGSFLDPAHNCSHILQSNPTARSGNTLLYLRHYQCISYCAHV